MIIVVDASVAVKWFAHEEDHEKAIALAEAGHDLIAPDIIFAEVGNVMRRKVRGGFVSNEQAAASVQNLEKAFKHTVSSARLVNLAFANASLLDHSIYDMMYLACALEETGSLLVTADEKFTTKATAAGYAEIVLTLGAACERLSTGQENENG